MITKIKMKDSLALRQEILNLSLRLDQLSLANWEMQLARRSLTMLGVDYHTISEVDEAIIINELWQINKTNVSDVRKASFAIHKLARKTESENKKTVLRVVGHAVATGHVKEHALVAADYAVKVVGLVTSNDMGAIIKEREWQLNALKIIVNS